MASTLTASITDKYGFTIFSRASLSDSATTTIWADKYNELSTTIVEGKLLKTPMAGPITVTLVPSVALTGTFKIYIYYESNGKVNGWPVPLTLTSSTTKSSDALPINGYLIGITIVPTVTTSPSASISPSSSSSVSPSVSISPSVSPSLSKSASVSPSVSVSPSTSVSPSLSASPSVSPSISVSPSVSVSPSTSVSPSLSKSASVSPSVSKSPSISPSVSPSE